MSRTPFGTVKDSGASAGDFLIGVKEQELNRGLRIKVHKNQEKGHGGRVKGSFDLVEAGTGTYAEYLLEFVGDSFIEAKELIEKIQEKGGKALKCLHLLNCNKLLKHCAKSSRLPTKPQWVSFWRRARV
ncbi:hypothetical protein [Desulforhabdus amnigena]|uniref:Uncharacterized protein n=1 Tax=Desulforhabdus amnigena TaxID=40218 RepID=A0A9W6FVG3_9BACT|nr:hypothetical protein [Desulforhabdus amnigena]NLJ28901.1 hypothetical protein [Deltaproteobacteria bacterium]GLI35636.1 hypothetical protein DAMNIGENAA_30690 [Desulforhabdus amnigena]